MTSRETILNKIRLSAKSRDPERINSVKHWLDQKHSNTLPSIAKRQGVERIHWFIHQAQSKGARVLRAEWINELPELIGDSLGDGHTATNDIAELLVGMPISNPSDASTTCISGCFSAIAESGSIVITSDSPESINQIFLCDNHFVVLFIDQIADCMESVWQSLQEKGGYPRHMTLVSGPSSTGDIELEMENGVHGPKTLHIILVTNRGSE